MSDPPTVRPDPDHFAKSLECWRENREWLIALAAELGYTAERTCRLGRVWLERFAPQWDDPPHIVTRRVETCIRLGVPLIPPPEGPARPGPKKGSPKAPLIEPAVKAEIKRATGSLAAIATRHGVSLRTVRRIRLGGEA